MEMALVLNLPLLYLLGNSQGKWIKVKKLTQLNSFANFLTKSAETTWCELEIKNCFIEYVGWNLDMIPKI